MSMRWVVALGSCALLIAGCTAEEHDSPASRDDLLPSIEDLPTGSEVDVLEGEEQLVLSVALDANQQWGIPFGFRDLYANGVRGALEVCRRGSDIAD